MHNPQQCFSIRFSLKTDTFDFETRIGDDEKHYSFIAIVITIHCVKLQQQAKTISITSTYWLGGNTFVNA